MRATTDKKRRRPLRDLALGAGALCALILLVGTLVSASGHAEPKHPVALDDALENKVLGVLQAQKRIPADHGVFAYADGSVFVVFDGAGAGLGSDTAAGATARGVADAIFSAAPLARTVTISGAGSQVIGTYDRAQEHVAAAASDAVQAASVVAGGSVATTTSIVAPPVVQSDTTLTVTGQVGPDVASGRVKVRLYRLVGQMWKAAGVYTVSVAGGAFASSFKPTLKGKWRVRADYLGSAELRTVSSQSAYVSTLVR